jgi:hypothetical protein
VRDACFAGIGTNACGINGAQCAQCVTDEACLDHRCRYVPSNGGSSGGGGGGATAGGHGGGSVSGGSGGSAGGEAPRIPVQLKWRTVLRDSNPFCPPTFTFTDCIQTVSCEQARLEEVRLNYPTCSSFSSGLDLVIDCSNNCSTRAAYCNNYQVTYQEPHCVAPYLAGQFDCTWLPPIGCW